MLWYHYTVLSCLSVCDVGVLWPNGWMDQDEAWFGGTPRSGPQCVRWGPTSPHFVAHVYYGQSAGWTKVPLNTEVGLNPGHIVLDGDPAPQGGGTAPPNIQLMSGVAKQLDGSRCHLVRR